MLGFLLEPWEIEDRRRPVLCQEDSSCLQSEQGCFEGLEDARDVAVDLIVEIEKNRVQRINDIHYDIYSSDLY
jgi:hypothetical protein